MHKLDAKLKGWKHLTSNRPPAEKEVFRIVPAIPFIATASECRPTTLPIFFHPYGKEQGHVLRTHGFRETRQEQSREDGHIPSTFGLMKKSVLDREFDIADSRSFVGAIGCQLLLDREGSRELNVLRGPVIEIDAARHTNALRAA